MTNQNNTKKKKKFQKSVLDPAVEFLLKLKKCWGTLANREVLEELQTTLVPLQQCPGPIGSQGMDALCQAKISLVMHWTKTYHSMVDTSVPRKHQNTCKGEEKDTFSFLLNNTVSSTSLCMCIGRTQHKWTLHLSRLYWDQVSFEYIAVDKACNKSNECCMDEIAK